MRIPDGGYFLDIGIDDPDAVPAWRAVYELSCRDDRWPAAVIDCFRSRSGSDCAKQLDDQQTSRFRARMKEWTTRWRPGCWRTRLRASLFDPVSQAGFTDPSGEARRRLITELCGTWTQADRSCFANAADERAIASCRNKLAPDAARILTDRLRAVGP